MSMLATNYRLALVVEQLPLVIHQCHHSGSQQHDLLRCPNQQ